MSPARKLALLLIPALTAACSSYESRYSDGQRDFQQSNLRFGSLKGLRLDDADFSGSNLVWCDARNVSLKRGKLESCNLRGANFSGADLRGANLRGSILGDVDFRRADLREADLRGLSFRAVKLEGSNLQGARLEKADLRSTDLSKAVIEKASLILAVYDDETQWPAGFDPKLLGAVRKGQPTSE